MPNLVAVATLLHHAVHHEASLRQTGEVLLRGRRPAFSELGTTRLGAELYADDEALVNLSLEIDDGVRVGDLLLLGDEMRVHAVTAEGILQDVEGQFRIGGSVGDDGLRDG